MNRRSVSIVVFLAVAAVVVLISGCTRPMSSGPIPTPKSQAVPSGTVSTTQEPMSSVATSVAAEATATVASATGQVTPPPLATTVPLATAVPAATQPPAQVVATPVPSGVSFNYTVKPGDRLFSIGRQFGVSPYAIAQVNRLGPPYTIYPGQVLVIPGGGSPGPSPTPGAGPTTYTVQAGDTVYSIGRKFGKSAAAIINANNLANPHLIFPGQVLKIP